MTDRDSTEYLLACRDVAEAVDKVSREGSEPYSPAALAMVAALSRLRALREPTP